MATQVESPHGEVRFRQALRWLSAQPPGRPLLLLAPSLGAGSALLRAATQHKGAVFGWALESLSGLAVRLSALSLATRGLTLAPPLALEAVCVRVVGEQQARGRLGRLGPIADRPGLPRALHRTFSELALAAIEPEAVPDELGELYREYRASLVRLGLADRAQVYSCAIELAATSTEPPLGVPLCAYDPCPKTRLERDLLEVLARRSPLTFATVASNDVAASALATLFALDHAPRTEPRVAPNATRLPRWRDCKPSFFRPPKSLANPTTASRS